MADSPTEVVLPKYTVLASCPGGSVVGLFVVFRPKRSAASTDALRRVAEVMEERDVDGSGFVDGHFYVAIVGASGFLELVHDTNPWHDIFVAPATAPGTGSADNPHAVKLSPFQKYEGCLVRHPDPQLVRDFAAYLGSNAHPERFASWGERGAIVKELSLALESAQLKLQVSETATDFVPQGSARYGHWVLYRDMPHGTCSALTQQVTALQTDLAKLRYPVGSQERPFDPVTRDAKPSPDQNKGFFDGKVLAAAARFQTHATAGEAFKLLGAAKPVAQGGNGYSYLLGAPEHQSAVLEEHCAGVIDAATGDMIGTWVDAGLRKPGPILLPISSAIGSIWMLQAGAVAAEAWDELCTTFGTYHLISGHSFRNILDKGGGNGKRLNSIHKTGLALDFRGGATARTRSNFPIRFEAHWVRSDRTLDTTASAVQRAESDVAAKVAAENTAKATLDTKNAALTAAQAKLAAAQATPATATVIAADKRAVTSAESGVKSATTAHEKAKAATTAARAKLDAARTNAEAARTASAADEAGEKARWKVRWRLYAHAPHDYFHTPSTMTALRERLAAYPQALTRRLAGMFGGMSSDAATTAWIATAIAPHTTNVARILTMTDEQIRASYLRETVRQWIYNPYEIDGGSASATAWRPTDSSGDFPPAPFAARCHVNITALGALCGMARIGGTRVRDTSKPGATHVTTQLRVDKNASTIAQLLVYLKGDSHHADDVITILRNKVRLTPTYHPGACDADFLKTWTEAMPDMGPQTRTESGLGLVSFTGFDVAATFAVTTAGETVIQRVFDKIGTFSQSFTIVTAGPLTGLTAGTTQAGSAMKTTLGEALTRFKEASKPAPAPATTTGTKPAKVPPPKPSTKKDREDWRVVLRPAVVPMVQPDDVLELPAPPKSNLEDMWRPLEWWHYQHESANGVAWGDLLEMCGYSQEALEAAEEPPATGATVFPRGVGYHHDNFPDTTGGCPVGEVENIDTYVPVGG